MIVAPGGERGEDASGNSWLTSPLCGLKKCECELLRAVVFMFEKLQT